METHLVSAKDLCAKLCNNLAVYGHYTCLYELISLTAAAYTGIGEELIQTQRLVGIVVDFLVLDTLLHAVLGIGVVSRRVLTLLLIWSRSAIRGTALLAVLIIPWGTIASLARLTISAARLLAILIIAGLTRLIAARLLTIGTLTRSTSIRRTLLTIAAARSLAILIVTRLAWLIAARLLAVVIPAWTVSGALRCATLQTCTKSFRTETALIIIIKTRTLIGWTLSCVNTRAW